MDCESTDVHKDTLLCVPAALEAWEEPRNLLQFHSPGLSLPILLEEGSATHTLVYPVLVSTLLLN